MMVMMMGRWGVVSLHILNEYLGNGTGCRTVAIATSLLLTSGPARCEAVLYGCGTSPVHLFSAIATVFQLYI